MDKVKMRTERCKGCYLCIEFCKPGALHISDYTNGKGVVVPAVDQNKCVQCGSCYSMCPDLVFEIL